jgi:hypothetical protein
MNDHGEQVDDITDVERGSTIEEPDKPTEFGYQFHYWYYENEAAEDDEDRFVEWDFEKDTVEKDTTLIAKWTLDPPDATIEKEENDDSVTFTVDASHKLGDKVTLTYQWFDGSSALTEPSEDGNVYVADGDANDTYICVITASDGKLMSQRVVDAETGEVLDVIYTEIPGDDGDDGDDGKGGDKDPSETDDPNGGGGSGGGNGDENPVPTPDKVIGSTTEVPDDLNGDDHIAYVFGYPDGDVKPERSVTRAEVATMLYRLLTDERRSELSTEGTMYPDVSENAWYRGMVSAMTRGGYIEGYPDGTFRGDNFITRAEFVAVVARFLGNASGVCNYSDVSRNHWAFTYIAEATGAGWIDGYPDGTFEPENYITRAEAMKILNHVLERGVNENSELLDFKKWPDNADIEKWYYYEVIEATNAHTYSGTIPEEQWKKILPSDNK